MLCEKGEQVVSELESLQIPKYACLIAGEGEDACSMHIPFDVRECERLAEYGWRVKEIYLKPLTDKQAAEAAEGGHTVTAATGNFLHPTLNISPYTPKKDALERIREYRRRTQVFGRLNFAAALMATPAL
jgi:hypothetical protein